MPSSWAEVYIDNDQQYVSDDGVVHVVGEIINESDYPINQIKVSAIFILIIQLFIRHLQKL